MSSLVFFSWKHVCSSHNLDEQQPNHLQEHHNDEEQLQQHHHPPHTSRDRLLLLLLKARHQECGLQDQRRVCGGRLSFTWLLMCWMSKFKTSEVCVCVCVCVLQLCGAADCIWSLELHSDDECLHWRRPHEPCRPEHWVQAGPEGLAGAEDGGAGRQIGRLGDRLLLGNQPSVTWWESAIRPHH